MHKYSYKFGSSGFLYVSFRYALSVLDLHLPLYLCCYKTKIPDFKLT